MPMHDKTIAEEVDEGIAENIRLGLMRYNGDGTYSLTDAGKRHVESLLLRKDSPHAK